MQPAFQIPLRYLVLAAALAAEPAVSADLDALPSLNAAITESSISGLSSGAFMAVQFGTAWSSIVKGVGIISGGPFYCAQTSSANATGACMKGPPPSLRVSIEMADRKAQAGEIDPTDNLRGQQIYLFHGYNDDTVTRPVTDAAAEFYEHYVGPGGNGHLFYQQTLGAGHAFIVPDTPPTVNLNGCPVSRSPFIDRCGSYDQAGVILQHIYGALNAPANPEALSATVKSFDQTRYAQPDTAGALSLGRNGYVFVPKDCEASTGPPCRVHVVLHGCRQNADAIGRQLVDRAGFNAWADTNRVIVLYPQTAARGFWLPPWQPYNPLACWDWWGYVSGDDSYVTKSGRQIQAIKAMLDALTAGYRPAIPAETPGNAPGALAVIDTSDTAAALAWTPVRGATRYRISRANTDGNFVTVGSITASSFADTGLAPQTFYRWHVTAIINGSETPTPAEASATTHASPPPCEQPGNCPIGALTR